MPASRKFRLPRRGPLFLLAVALLVTLAAWRLSIASVDQRAEAAFQVLADRTAENLRQRLRDYEHLLRGAAGLFAANGWVNRLEWHDFFSAQDLARQFPGTRAVAFAQPIPRDKLAQHQENMRRQGFPDYRIWPEGERAEYSTALYLEPFDSANRPILGYDMLTEPVRREAMERARDTGQTSLSGKVRLILDDHPGEQPGFLLYMPILRQSAPTGTPEELRRAFVGWVYAPFRSHDFMSAALARDSDIIDLELFDGPVLDQDHLLFDSDRILNVETSEDAPFSTQRTLEIYGRVWTLYIEARDPFDGTLDRQKPLIVLILGLAISVLVFGVAHAMAETEHRAQALAAEMTRALAQKSADLERSNQDLAQFAYVASHDLQEPLRMVSSYLQLIARRYDDKLDQDGRQFIAYAVGGAKRMSGLINDLLAYSRVGTRGQEMAPFPAAQAVETALSNLTFAIDEAGAEVLVGSLPTITGDSAQITSLFQNLIGNAVKYRDSERPLRISVSGTQTTEGWLFSVADNGIGIDRDYFDKIFVIFQRLHTQEAYGGTGIGLAICKRIVERHGGRIWVDSVPGQGSTFNFTLSAGS